MSFGRQKSCSCVLVSHSSLKVTASRQQRQQQQPSSAMVTHETLPLFLSPSTTFTPALFPPTAIEAGGPRLGASRQPNVVAHGPGLVYSSERGWCSVVVPPCTSQQQQQVMAYATKALSAFQNHSPISRPSTCFLQLLEA